MSLQSFLARCVQKVRQHALDWGTLPFMDPSTTRPFAIIAEVALVFLFLFPNYFDSGSRSVSLDSFRDPLFLASSGAIVALYMAVILLIIKAVGGFAAFSLRKFAFMDLARGAGFGLAIQLIILPLSLVFSALDIKNDFFGSAGHNAPPGPIAIAALIIFVALAAYFEELFFRCYLLARFQKAGIPLPAAILISTALFAAGHGYEGLIGITDTAIFGIVLSWRWIRKGNIHEIAIAHALSNLLAFGFAFL